MSRPKGCVEALIRSDIPYEHFTTASHGGKIYTCTGRIVMPYTKCSILDNDYENILRVSSQMFDRRVRRCFEIFGIGLQVNFYIICNSRKLYVLDIPKPHRVRISAYQKPLSQYMSSDVASIICMPRSATGHGVS